MSTALLPLRGYQRDALDAVQKIITSKEAVRPAIVLPTGGGKTVCFAHQAKEHIQANPAHRVLVLVHTDELVSQAARKITEVAPHLSVGIVKAAKDEVHADVIVGSVQTLRNERRRSRITNVGLVIVDECHHATARTYRAILAHFGCLAGRVPAIGYTATLARGDRGPLGEIWQAVAFSRDISWMVRKCFLIVPRGKRVEVPDLDLSKVRSTRADYREGELGEALAESLAPELVAKAYAEHAADRSGIAFFPTVASACVFADAFNDAGITCEVVHGALPTEERRAILARLESGVTQVVSNCMVLTEGFDSPRVSCIVVGRPTKSKPLYIQMVGRGLRVDLSRPYEEQDCLILDVCGAGAVHDLRSIVDLSERPIKEPKDGASLIELEDKFDETEAAGRDETEYYDGPVEVKDFDPLAARSARVWNKTDSGTYFVSGGADAYVFIIPGTESGLWSVAWCTRYSKDSRYVCCAEDGVPARSCVCGKADGKRGGFTEHTNLDLEMAMGWGETFAVDMGGDPFETLTKKAAPWRRKRAGEKAIRYAKSLGIKVKTETFEPGTPYEETVCAMRAGELSDLIDRVVATRRIDPIVKKMKGVQ